MVVLRRKFCFDDGTDFGIETCHLSGPHVGHAQIDAGFLSCAVDEGGHQRTGSVLSTLQVRHDEVAFATVGNAVKIGMSVVVGLTGKFYHVEIGEGFGQFGQGVEPLLHPIKTLQGAALQNTIGLSGVYKNFEGHESAEVFLKKLQIAIQFVVVRYIVEHIAGGVHATDAIKTGQK